MPYAIRKLKSSSKKKGKKKSGRYVVYKKDGGKIIGHTTSHSRAVKMVAAIYAHENGYTK